MIAALSIVAIWSAAEAAIFFLVADIPVSWIAVSRGTRPGIVAALVAAVGSVAGALAVLAWGNADPNGAARAMAALPGIDSAMVADAARQYEKGIFAVLAGAFSGVPFKLFALEAAKQGATGLLLWSPLLRLPRFLAVALLAGGLSHLLDGRMTRRQRLWLLAVLWMLFYAFYFAVMPS